MRTVTKQLATMEDLSTGQGPVVQQRGGLGYTLGKIDQAYAVLDQAQLKALSVTKFTYAFLNNTYYRYNEADASGITPDVGTGSWLADVVSKNVSDITDVITADVVTNADNIATNTDGIATNASNGAAHATNIAINTNNIAINTASIAANTASITKLKGLAPNNQTGTSYTLVLTDADAGEVWMNNAAANVLTIPTDASVAFPIETVILVQMEGAGVTSVTAATGVTLNGIVAGSGDLTQYNGVALKKRSDDVWVATPLTVA